MAKKALFISFFVFILSTVFSCRTDVYRAGFTSKLPSKVFVHQDKHFLFKMPENWDFVKIENELDTVLKFTSENKKINGYLKRYIFRRGAYTLEAVVGDYFLKRARCKFDKVYKGISNNRIYFLLSGYFRAVYPIVTIITLHGSRLYELTMVESVDKEDVKNREMKALLKKLSEVAFSVFSSMKFHKKAKKIYRKRYGFKISCPKNWELSGASLEGEIASLGYKDKIIVLSLKLIKDSGSASEREIQKEINKLILDFKKEMKKKSFNVHQKKTAIFGIKADLVIVSNITVEVKNQNEVTTGFVKKYIFHKKGRIYEFLYLYSAKDINNNITSEVNRIIKSVEHIG